MNAFALDTETEPITETTPLPRLVCLSYALSGAVDLVRYPDARAVLEVASEGDAPIVTHNGAFDFAVLGKHEPDLLPSIFELYEHGRIRCTKIREALQRIETGTMIDEVGSRIRLEELALEYLGVQLDKGEDGWRTRFGELRELPLDQWPERAKNYATGDAASTLKIFQKQKDKPDETLQTRADFCLSLISAHGVVTDPEAVDQFELNLRERAVEMLGALEESGLVRRGSVKKAEKDGSRNTKLTRELVEEAYTRLGRDVPRTPPSMKFRQGQVKYDEDTLKDSGDDRLVKLADYAHLAKLLDSFLPMVRAATYRPVHCSYDVLKETGRTSCSKPNWQQLPRERGARECVIARPGKVLVACDFMAAELRALAQICFSWFGASDLREAFLAGKDPHVILAAQIDGISIEEALERRKAGDKAFKLTRQFAKIPNFGMGGGMGPEAFSSHAKGYGYDVSIERATELKQIWLNTWTEMRQYFRVIATIVGDFGDRKIEQFGSGRVRGGLAFTQCANTWFQGLVADFAKDALWEVTKRCYVDRRSPLFGSRPEFFVHDEVIVEADEEQAHEVAVELERVMIEVEQKWLPDVPAAADAHLMRRWSKEAEAVRDDAGRLIPWEDRKRAA